MEAVLGLLALFTILISLKFEEKMTDLVSFQPRGSSLDLNLNFVKVWLPYLSLQQSARHLLSPRSQRYWWR